MEPRFGLPAIRFSRARLLGSKLDGHLVELVRAGHAEAFETIVARYRRPLLRYCERFMRHDQAEDVVQEALARAYTSLETTSGELELRPWLYRIVHNGSISALRRERDSFEELTDDIDGVEPPDRAFERSERLRDLVASIKALPERQRSAIMLRELEGRTYEEIAAELGVSEGAVHQLVHRARVKLRDAAAALVPPAIAARLPWGSGQQPAAARAAELATAGGASAALAKVCAAALVTGAIAGGVAGGGPARDAEIARGVQADRGAAAEADAVRERRTETHASASPTPGLGRARSPDTRGAHGGRRASGASDESRGPGSGRDESREGGGRGSGPSGATTPAANGGEGSAVSSDSGPGHGGGSSGSGAGDDDDGFDDGHGGRSETATDDDESEHGDEEESARAPDADREGPDDDD